MDSDNFPFYRAELYHQYHNDFQVRARAWARAWLRPGLGRGRLASRLASASCRVRIGDTPRQLPACMRVPGLRRPPIGGPLPIYLNMHMHMHMCMHMHMHMHMHMSCACTCTGG